MESNNSNVQAAVEAVERLSKLERVQTEDGLVVVPKGKQVVDLKPYVDARRDRPERRAGTAQFTQLASFVQHAQRFADGHSAIFAIDNPAAPKLMSVLDYHEGNHVDEDAGPVEGKARFGQHRGVYNFPVSDEWKAWTSAPAQMAQDTFAAFLEERIADVLAPEAVGDKAKEFAGELGITLASPARLMELSRGLSVRVDSRVTNAANLSTGEVQLSYEESHTARDGGPLKVPGGFVIAIPVFRGGALYQIPVRLLYRVHRSEGRVAWSVRLHRADRSFADAFKEAAEYAREATGLPLFYGTPEATAS